MITLQALLTPVVAIAVGVIAFAQWWTARNRLKLDLFDRRWAVYVAVRELLSEIVRDGNVSQERQDSFSKGSVGHVGCSMSALTTTCSRSCILA
jgi:hypothetical protein